MDFSLRTGDRLVVELTKDPGARAAVPGDLLLFLGGKDAPVVAHRVLLPLPWAGALLTKGDFRLLPDPPAARESWIGLARSVARGGREVWLGCPVARLTGLLLAAYAYPCAAAFRAAQALLWALRWAAVRAPRGFLDRDGTGRLLAFLETAHLRFLRPLLRALPDLAFERLARHSELRHADALRAVRESAGDEGTAQTLAGEIRGIRVLSGEVRICGDLVVLPGAELVLRPGTRVVFQREKRFHHCVERSWSGTRHALAGPDRRQIMVYGTLRVLGEAGAPVRFESSAGAASLTFLGDGEHRVAHASFAGQTLQCLDRTRLELSDCAFADGPDYAVLAAGNARAVLRRVSCRGGWGAVAAHEGSFVAMTDCLCAGPRTAVLVKGAARARLVRCALRAAGAPGLREGVRLEGSAAARLSRSVIAGYPVGILLRGAARAVLVRHLSDACGLGLFAEEGARFLLGRSRVLRSGTHGL